MGGVTFARNYLVPKGNPGGLGLQLIISPPINLLAVQKKFKQRNLPCRRAFI